MKPNKANNNLKKKGWLITQIKAYFITLRIIKAKETMNKNKGITPKGKITFNFNVK
jgi:DNA polymerase III sliding clamp (beta) subunit (PCNA family)